MVTGSDIIIIETNISGLHYFRKMMKTDSPDGYFSHVFFTEPMTSKKLREKWFEIISLIAVRYQSETEELIERNNFYVCFYIEGELDESLRTKIEGDEFCARKYVMQDSYPGEEQAIENIIDKLFGFTGGIVMPDEPIHMNSVLLSNFRVYEKERLIDFTYSEADNADRNRKAASFVLIYAKNGTGKTSVFDGIEYLFKGVIDRIDDLQKKNEGGNSPNTMYHNLKHSEEKSYVSAILSDGEELERRVAQNKNNDMRRNTPSKGKEFIAGNDRQKKWKEIILPHESIDGFIMAKKPEEVYKEWIKNSNLQEESDGYLRKAREKKMIENEISELEEQQNAILKKISDLSQSRNSAEDILLLIEQFNAIKKALHFPEGEDLTLSIKDGISAYYTLINKTMAYLRMSEKMLTESVLPEKERLVDIRKKGTNYYAEKHRVFEEAVESIRNLKAKAERRRKYDEAEAASKSLADKRNKFEKELHLIENILALGGESAVRDKISRIEELRRIDTLYSDIIAKESEEISVLEIRCAEIKADIEAAEQTVEDKRRYQDAISAAEQYEILRNLLEVSELNKVHLDEDISNLEESIRKNQKLENDLESICFPESIADMSDEFAQECSELVGREPVRGILYLTGEYKKIQAELEVLNHQMVLYEREEDELGRVISMAGAYVAAHPDSCECPVCGRQFSTNQLLYSAIESNSARQSRYLDERLSVCRSRIVVLEDKYTAEVESVRKEINGKIEELRKKAYDASNSLNSKMKQKEIAGNQFIENKRKRDELDILLKRFGEDYAENPVSAVERWYKVKKEELKVKNEQSEQLQERRKKADFELKEINAKQKEVKSELESIGNSAGLQKVMEYVKVKGDDWSAEKGIDEIKSSLEETERQYFARKEESKEYDDVKELNLDYFSEQLRVRNEEASSLLKEEQIYNKYFLNEMTQKILQKEVERITQMEEQIKWESDILERIKEEKAAQQFYAEYADADKRAGKITERMSSEKKKYDKCEIECEAMKKELEVKLKEHFNQTFMNWIYNRIDPHREMKDVKYTIDFSEDGKPLLYITVTDGVHPIRPEWYFSTAQLNTLAFSSFFSKALSSDLPLKTIFVDDPIAHFDDMNILGFADLMRCLITETSFQFVMSTHDRKIYDIMRRKINPKYYRATYIEL